MAKNSNLRILKRKSFALSFKVLLVQLSETLLRVFCIFESRDYAIRSGKNLPIASEIIDVELSLMYVMLYIILKHFLSWFQKCFIYEILSNPSIFMKIYDLSGQNDNFRQKNWNLIMWRIISQQIKCWWRCDRFCPKILSMTTASGKNHFFQKLYKWRHIDRKSSNSTNSCTNLVNGRLYSHLSQK